MKGSNDRLEALASRIAQETVEAWETHVRQGQQAVVESHQESLSKLAGVDLSCGDRCVTAHLITLLDDNDKHLLQGTVEVLGQIGTDDPAAIDSVAIKGMLDRLVGESENVRDKVIEALERIDADDPVVMNVLIGRLRDDSTDVRLHTTEALARIGTNDSEAIEALIDLLGDGSE